jgi:hypothetical protein
MRASFSSLLGSLATHGVRLPSLAHHRPKLPFRITAFLVMTDSAPTPVLLSTQILTHIGMTLRTMGLSGIDRIEAIPPEKIFTMGDRLQMTGIHTHSHSTTMIKFFSMWNQPDQEFIQHAVSIANPEMRNPLPAIAIPVCTSYPEPTARIWLGHNSAIESSQ